MKGNARLDWAVLILRLGVGLVALYYGCQKVLGVFGGPGIHGTVGFMESKFGIPPVFAILSICGEFLGGLGMIFGALTSVAAFGFSCVMVVATYENWKEPGVLQSLFGHPNPQDLPHIFITVPLLVGALAIMILGGGSFSVDNKLFAKKPKKGPAK
jgi:putative oxidoreductase